MKRSSATGWIMPPAAADSVTTWSNRWVWGTWAAATAVALLATAVHGRWLPWSDDFDVLPFVAGAKPVTLAWLWQQHNEHRIPLLKLMFVGLGRLSGADYRWTLAANALLLSLAAAALILTARRLRGWTSWTDALFPAVLLHLGQGALVWAFQTQFVFTTVLGSLFVAAAVAAPRTSPWRAAALAVSACLMPLTGSSGLVIAAAAAVLLTAEAIRPPAGSAEPLARWIMAAGAALTLTVAVAYVSTLRLMPTHGYAGPVQSLSAALDALASYPGSLVPRMRLAWLAATALAITGTVAAAVVGLRGAPRGGRGRLVILLGYLAALGLVAVAIGYGRGAGDFTHLYGHYSTLALGVPVAVGLLWAALPQSQAARGAQAALCIVTLVVGLAHARHAIRGWGAADESWAVIATDMRGSLPTEQVADRHAAALYFIDTPDIRRKIAAAVAMLRRTSFPLYCAREPAGDAPGP